MAKTTPREPVTPVRPLQRPRVKLTIEAPTFTAGKISRDDFDQWTIGVMQQIVDFSTANRAVPSGLHSAGFRKAPGKKTILELWLWSARDKKACNTLRRTNKQFEDLPPQTDYKKA